MHHQLELGKSFSQFDDLILTSKTFARMLTNHPFSFCIRQEYLELVLNLEYGYSQYHQ